MKILHTADWHLGKKLEGKERYAEQRAALESIVRIAESECVDVVIAAGDIFDTSVPPARAEELFYETAVMVAGGGRVFVAVAGNHDDADRLAAPNGIAKALDILLVGSRDLSVYTRESKGITGGDGFIRISRNGETLNLIAAPYPYHTILAKDKPKDMSYTELVREYLGEIAKAAFSADGYNVTASHLFMTKSGSSKDGDESRTDERELGTAALLPVSVLPEADYTALGHIHKPMTVSSSANVYYSGSLQSCSFDDTSEKSVIIADFKTLGGKKTVSVKRVPIVGSRRLIKCEVTDFDSAMRALTDNADAYVLLNYKGNAPLTASEVKSLKATDSFARIDNTFTMEKTVREYKKRTPAELFCDYYKKLYTKEPPADMLDMFLTVLDGGEDNL